MTSTYILKHPVLAAAKAAGRTTRLGQDSAFAVVKQAVCAVTRTNGLVVSSVKFLNPFRWAKRSAGRRKPQECKPAGGGSPAVPRTIGVPCDTGSAASGRRAVRTRSQAPKTAVSDVQDAGTRAAKVAAEPRFTPSRRRAPAQTARARTTRRARTPQDVTPADASAAVFAGVTEKVMFTRAHRDLASQNEATRARAARILGGIGHELSGRALTACLARDSSAEVRKECVNGLTTLGMKEHLPAVERALSDACSSVRLAALEALGNLKSPSVVAEVIEVLDDPEESVQRKAFQVLETITGKQMGETFPEDEHGRRFLIARWRAWQDKKPLRQGG